MAVSASTGAGVQSLWTVLRRVADLTSGPSPGMTGWSQGSEHGADGGHASVAVREHRLAANLRYRYSSIS